MMTDDLVKRLRYLSRVFRKHDVEELTYNDYLSARLYPDEAADRIEALTAERDEMSMSCLSADGEAQRAWDAQKAAEAERDRLRTLLAEADRQIVWEGHGFGNDFASQVEAALKGDSHE